MKIFNYFLIKINNFEMEKIEGNGQRKLMKIFIKTSEVTLQVEDNITLTDMGTNKRDVPKLDEAITAAIEQVLKLHNEIAKENR